MSLLGKQDLNILVDEVKQDINRKVNAIKGDLFAPSENTKLTTVNGVKEFTCEESGYVDNVYLEGETLVNLVDLKSNAGFNGDGTFKLENNGVTLSCASGAESTYAFRQYNLQNKEYTFICEIDFSCESIEVMIVDPVVQNIQYVVDKNIKMIRTKFTPPTSSSTLLRVDCNGIGEAKFRNIMILEGDYTNKEVNYIEGLKSVGQGDKIEVLSYRTDTDITPSGLTFTDNKYIECSTISPNYGTELSFSGVCYTNEYIQVEQNMQYVLCNVNSNIVLYDESKVMINKDVAGSTSSITNLTNLNGVFFLNTGSRCKYIRVTTLLENKNKFKIYKNSQCDKKQILTTLRSLPNGVKDEIVKQGDKYYKIQRCGEFIFDGSGKVDPSGVSNQVNTIAFNTFPNLLPKRSEGDFYYCISDKFKSEYQKNELLDEEHCLHVNHADYIRIRINKSKLTSQNIEGVKAWLKDNPLTVVYELATPIITELPNFNPRTFADKTTFLCNSGIVQAEVDFEVTNNLRNEIDVMKEMLSNFFFLGNNGGGGNNFKVIKGSVTGSSGVDGVFKYLNGSTVTSMYYVDIPIDFKPDLALLVPENNASCLSLIHKFPVQYNSSSWEAGNYIVNSYNTGDTTGIYAIINMRGDGNVFRDGVLRFPLRTSVSNTVRFNYVAIKYE